MRSLTGAFVCALFLAGAVVIPAAPGQVAAKANKDDKGKKKRRGPALEYKKFRRTREVDIQMREKRAAIRKQLEQLLQYEKDDKERPALLFRLAENYFEEATAFFNQAMRLDEKVAKDPTNERLRAEVARQKKALRAKEDEWRAKAIDQYKKIIAKYTNYPDLDQIYFYLAQSLWDLKRQKEALATYRQLIKNYPRSKYVPDAYLAFGEYYFDNAKLEKALMAYKKVAEYKEAEIYPYALYKQGWCYYNLHEWGKAKEMFSSVVYLYDMGSGAGSRRIELRKEALHDFVQTYGHEGSASAAPRVFKRLAPKEAHGMLVNLAGLYFGEGQDKKAILLYTYLIKEEKCSAEVPFYQGRIVDCGSRVGNKRYTVQQVRRLVSLFKEVKKCLANPSEKEKQRIREARELAEVTLRKLASTWYKEAKETKQKETFAYAQEMFGDYLELFPESKDAYDMRFAYAELLFHRLSRYERAASEYSKVVAHDLAWLKKHKRFPTKKKDKKGRSAPGTYLCDAAYKAVLAHRELMKKERKRGRGHKGKEKDKDPLAKKVIPRGKRRFIKAAEIYLDHCPKDQDLCSVKFDIAKTYYDYQHYDVAVRRFDEVVGQCTGEDLAEYAANLVLDTYNLKQDWDNLNKYARKYYKNPALMKNDKLRTFLQKLIPEIAFKRIEEGLAERIQKRRKDKKLAPLPDTRLHRRVGLAYIRFVKEFGKHELADEALFNAGVEFEKAERLDLAKKARHKLIEDYPTSDLVPGTLFNLAENYERMTDFNAAAELYENYARTYKKMKGLGKAVSYTKRERRRGKRRKRKRRRPPKKKPSAAKEKRFEGNRRTWNSEDAQNALMNAGIYREALKQYGKAIQDRLQFIELFPQAEDAPAVYYSLGLLYEKLNNHRKAAEVFARYSEDYFRSDTDKAIAAHMKRAVMLIAGKRKNWREAEKEMQRTISLYRKYSRRGKKKMPYAAEAAAHAKFILAESSYKEYIRYKFRSIKANRLKRDLAAKTKLLKKVEHLYTDVAKLKQPEWAIASLYKLGRAYEDFAQTFYKAPVPKGLTPEQRDLYMQMLRQKGQPWEDKAVAHFKAAVDKGSELGFYSRFTQRALKKLEEYGVVPREKLGFKLSVVADTASRSPLLTATWNEVQKNPELLDEPPLRLQRKGGSAGQSEAGASAPESAQPQPDEPKDPGAGQAGKDEEPKAPEELPDPARAVVEGEEPDDGFDF